MCIYVLCKNQFLIFKVKSSLLATYKLTSSLPWPRWEFSISYPPVCDCITIYDCSTFCIFKSQYFRSFCHHHHHRPHVLLQNLMHQQRQGVHSTFCSVMYTFHLSILFCVPKTTENEHFPFHLTFTCHTSCCVLY